MLGAAVTAVVGAPSAFAATPFDRTFNVSLVGGFNPAGAGSFQNDEVVECKLLIRTMGGTTPKFDCERPGNDVIRVKYGRGNPELHAEIAATRLLSALGLPR